jgi:hypothetical protein
MNSSSPTEIREQTLETIDFSRPFMPEELTPLYHTPAYASLTETQRLRYNQLSALYFNEQIMFFEKALARNVLGYFVARPLPEELKCGLRQFRAEEEQHSAMFCNLNRQCCPAIYVRQDFYFIQTPYAAARALDFISKRPTWFPLLLWLMHLQEERAIFYGRAFLKRAAFLELHFVAAQRRHLSDEVGHVGWDEALLDWVWPRTGFPLRWSNIRLFRWMIDEYFSTPKRSALRVVAALAAEFAELRGRYPDFCRHLRQLGNNPNYRRSLYGPGNVPNTFKRFDEWREFRSINRVMPGYIPRART